MNETPDIYSAFIALQGEMTPVKKDRENPFFSSNYATLLAIVEMLRPLLAKHRLGYTQTVVKDGEDLWMRTTVMLAGCKEIVVSDVPFSCVGKKPQELGSAVTYMKRYGLQCAFGVVVAEADDDDDGNRANGNGVKPKFDRSKVRTVTPTNRTTAETEDAPF